MMISEPISELEVMYMTKNSTVFSTYNHGLISFWMLVHPFFYNFATLYSCRALKAQNLTGGVPPEFAKFRHLKHL